MERSQFSLMSKSRSGSEPKSDDSPAPRVRRSPIKRQPKEVLERILEAATAAFTRDGYKGARMRSIAADAGTTIQLLVYHVKSKEKLWEMTMEHMLRRFESDHGLNRERVAQASATEQLRQLIVDLVHFSAANPQLHRIMTQEGGQLSPRLVWLCENFVRSGFEEFVSLTVAAQREGSVRADFQPERLRYAVVSIASVPFSVAAEYEYFIDKSPFSPGEIERTIEMICGMVFTA